MMTTDTTQALPARKHALAAITAVLLLAALLRIYHITQQSLWFDEAFAWNIIVQDDMYPRISTDTHPPLYYLLLRGWVALTGDSALAMRYLSALVSMLTVACMIPVARELSTPPPNPHPVASLTGEGEQARRSPGGRSRIAPTREPDSMFVVPILAALMLALADAEIFLAQEARNYALYSFLATLSMWTYLRWLRRPVRARALWWALSVAALVYTHYQGVFIPAIQGMHLLLFVRGRQSVAGIGALALSGLLVLPWFVGVTIPQAQNAITNDLPFAIPSNLETFLHLRDNYLGGQWALLLVLAVVGVASFAPLTNGSRRGDSRIAPTSDVESPSLPKQRGEGNSKTSSVRNADAIKPPPTLKRHLPHKWRRQKQSATDSLSMYGEGGGRGNWGASFLVVMWVALPFGVIWVGNYFAALLTERKLLIVAPAIALMVAFGLGRLRNPARALLVLAILVYGLTSVDYYRVKEPWDQIAAQIVPYAQPSDLALVEAGVGQYPMKYYWEHLLPEGTFFSTRSVLGDTTISPTDEWYTYYTAMLPELMARSQSQQVGEVATAWLVWWGGHEMMLENLAANGYVRTMTLRTTHLDDTIALYRYDHLPETSRATYQNGLTLRAAEIDAEHLRVDLWWSAGEVAEPPGQITVTSAMLLDGDGVAVAQMDSPPFYGERPLTSWSPGEVVFDPKPLAPVVGIDTIPPGRYTVIVKAYLWSSEGISDIPLDSGAPWIEVGTLVWDGG